MLRSLVRGEASLALGQKLSKDGRRMKRPNWFGPTAPAAERAAQERSMTALPVDRISLVNDLGIEVTSKSSTPGGVSGIL